jgi:hypothetical protein
MINRTNSCQHLIVDSAAKRGVDSALCSVSQIFVNRECANLNRSQIENILMIVSDRWVKGVDMVKTKGKKSRDALFIVNQCITTIS